ncbi:uncharacterized protein LOC123666478 [Melitaea cinxia]|uniref:uncharacterized protein LOC123666478 n=1 Tax=Melitaea cinxia TaxID=113334 RepID=UPI001E27139F|nr:uncharacterized protein LOC123666478 [Melitaea cinxia]
MELGVKENRVAVNAALHKVGMEPSIIFQTLQKLGISRMFVYRTNNRYSITSSVEDQKRSGRPRVVRTTKAVNAVKARIRRNPIKKQKILSREMKIPARLCRRVDRSKRLLSRYAVERHRNILFTDVKIFMIEEHYNKQNDTVYADSSKEAAQVVGKRDSPTGHKARTTQVWLKTNVLDFIRVGDWPSSRPDLNPLDFTLWSV